jgi:hypothetical protein
MEQGIDVEESSLPPEVALHVGREPKKSQFEKRFTYDADSSASCEVSGAFLGICSLLLLTAPAVAL